MDYAIRIPANKSLELEIEDILFRPPGRPSAAPLVRYKSFLYREGRGDSSFWPFGQSGRATRGRLWVTCDRHAEAAGCAVR